MRTVEECKERRNLYRLAEAHLVTDDATRALAKQRPQPPNSRSLVAKETLVEGDGKNSTIAIVDKRVVGSSADHRVRHRTPKAAEFAESRPIRHRLIHHSVRRVSLCIQPRTKSSLVQGIVTVVGPRRKILTVGRCSRTVVGSRGIVRVVTTLSSFHLLWYLKEDNT